MSMSGSLMSIKDIHSNNTVPSYEKQSVYEDVVSMYQEAEEVFLLPSARLWTEHAAPTL